MEAPVDNELMDYIHLLTANQKQSLLDVIKSFLNKQDNTLEFPEYTQQQISAFYEIRSQYQKGEMKTISAKEAHKQIRESHSRR
ncbi:MAG: hypothetical protein ACRDE2_02645 [Chitinophagaceae bacterium]